MTRIAQQVSRAIRILRGNRDESARASHLVVEKDLLMTYETDLLGQAEREKFFQSTFFERKTMSTKTAFKRVALVAAAALAFGGITAVTAQAAVNLTITGGYSATPIAGPANSTSVTAGAAREYVTISGGTFVGGITATTLNAAGSIEIKTPTVGTITVSGYNETAPGVFSTAVNDTITITVIASVPGTVYASSTVFGDAFTATPPILADGTFPITIAAGSSAAKFTLTEKDAGAVALGGVGAVFVGITATVTNGLLTASGGLTAGPTTYIAGIPTALVNFSLTGIAGLSGTSTVTFSANGVVLKSYSVIFTGVAVKVVATSVNSVIGIGSTLGTTPAGITANTGAIKIQEFDANGNAIVVNPLTLVSSDITKVLAVGTTYGTPGTTSVTANLVGGAAGTSSITFTDGALTSNALSVRVSSGVATSVVLSTDAASYPAGGAGTLSVTLSDAAGTLPSGAYSGVYTTTPSSSFALTVGSLALAALSTITTNDSGVATVAFNAPLSDGTTTISGTPASTITETAASFTVSSGASDAANAATDAANEATDAANAATDAANAAADSADAATQAAMDAGDKADAALAAVTALSQQVTSVLAKVAALSALLVRIIKKVKA